MEVEGYHCATNLYSLPLGGCNVVLGVQWLSSISPVLWDFQLFTMEFEVNGKKYRLEHNALPHLSIQEISLQQLDKGFYNLNMGILL